MSPVHQNSDAHDVAAAAVKAPEPELGSTSAPFEKECADRVVVGETNRAVKPSAASCARFRCRNR
jgi:hypothetical protein